MAAQFGQYCCSPGFHEPFGVHRRGGAGRNSAYRPLFVDPFSRLRPIRRPRRPRHRRRDRKPLGGIDNCGGRCILRRRIIWQLPVADRVDMSAEERRFVAIEDVKRRAWPRIDLKEKDAVGIDDEIRARETPDSESMSDACHAPNHLLGLCLRHICGLHGATVAECSAAPRRSPLLAEADHRRAFSIAEEERRDGVAVESLLVVAVLCAEDRAPPHGFRRRRRVSCRASRTCLWATWFSCADMRPLSAPALGRRRQGLSGGRRSPHRCRARASAMPAASEARADPRSPRRRQGQGAAREPRRRVPPRPIQVSTIRIRA